MVWTCYILFIITFIFLLNADGKSIDMIFYIYAKLFSLRFVYIFLFEAYTEVVFNKDIIQNFNWEIQFY